MDHLDIGINSCGDGLKIWHTAGGVVINPHARIGTNLPLHGCNCIGNNGLTSAVPKLGNHVDIGYGAVIIGGIEIADDVKIGANAVVNKSVLVPGCTVAGVPAKIVKTG